MNDWDDIRFFLEVARSGSISGASRALKVNHTTVSRRIQSFEAKHGVRLFERHKDGYQLTKAADAIYHQALEIEEQNQQISRTLFGQDTRLEGPISLTMPHDIFENILAEDLSEFHQENPGIQLNLIVNKGLMNMASRDADIAIRLTPSPPDYLVGREITPLQHAIYSNQEYSVHSKPVGLILWHGENTIPSWAEKHFNDCFVSLYVDDLSSMYAAVKAGFGIARMPCYMPDSLNDPSIRKLEIDLPKSDWSVWVLSHVDLRKTARVQYLREFLVKKLLNKKYLFEG